MRRSFAELAFFCVRDNPVPPGSVLLTGTGIVPPDGFTLEPGQTVAIRVQGIGVLANPVARAGELL
jgi:2-dehydro-3-deoxy-D-arabinonate dehydratase